LRYLKNYIIRVLVAFVIINLINNGALYENVKNRVIESYNLKYYDNSDKIVVDKTIKSVKSKDKLVKNNKYEKNVAESNCNYQRG
jgi:isoaspartyl peptidase/L-asparaginase-like protein (Ntn-hydrolase superfamily)